MAYNLWSPKFYLIFFVAEGKSVEQTSNVTVQLWTVIHAWPQKKKKKKKGREREKKRKEKKRRRRTVTNANNNIFLIKLYHGEVKHK